MLMYSIKDELENYVDRNSIMKCGKEYYYFSYSKLEEGCIQYPNEERVQEALNVLEIHNKKAQLGHNFKIVLLKPVKIAI